MKVEDIMVTRGEEEEATMKVKAVLVVEDILTEVEGMNGYCTSIVKENTTCVFPSGAHANRALFQSVYRGDAGFYGSGGGGRYGFDDRRGGGHPYGVQDRGGGGGRYFERGGR
jgi:hypothetical protein